MPVLVCLFVCWTYIYDIGPLISTLSWIQSCRPSPGETRLFCLETSMLEWGETTPDGAKQLERKALEKLIPMGSYF